MEALALLVVLGAALYIWANYGSEIKKRFWLWITEKSPYFKVSQTFSLTDKALRKYTSEALIKKMMELEAEVQRLQAQLREYEEKMHAHKEFTEQSKEQEDEKIKEVFELPILLAPTEPIKVYDADGVFRGYLDSIRGSFSEAYILVRTKDNELLIFGPDELQDMIHSEQTFYDQIKSGILMLAYDRYNRKVSPGYTKVVV